jgi:hypothetical protein
MMDDLRSHPDPKATKAVIETIAESAERDFQDDMMEELFSTKGKKS